MCGWPADVALTDAVRMAIKVIRVAMLIYGIAAYLSSIY
jgi:hypothetical protein